MTKITRKLNILLITAIMHETKIVQNKFRRLRKSLCKWGIETLHRSDIKAII